LSGSVARSSSDRRRRPPPAASSGRPQRPPGALVEHRDRQTAQRQGLEEHWQEHGPVFPTGLGTLLDPGNLRRGLRQVIEAAGLGRWHPHELRHSAVSLLSAAGVPLEGVADVLGHTRTPVTSTVYRHRTTPTVEAAVAPMHRLFQRPNEQ
jgi:integrase